MHVTKEDVPVKLTAPGAVARQLPDFGDATGYGTMSGEWFSLATGTDIAPLLEGLPGDGCQAPHWGYVLAGALVVTYAQQEEERCCAGELFYWPPGHSVRVEQDAELVLFSPQAEHTAVIDHMGRKLALAGP